VLEFRRGRVDRTRRQGSRPLKLWGQIEKRSESLRGEKWKDQAKTFLDSLGKKKGRERARRNSRNMPPMDHLVRLGGGRSGA